MKTISDLIKTDYNMDIFGITDDSRDVRPGYIFVATKGFNVDHFDYIDEAIKAGAVFIVADKKIERNFPHIIVDNIDDYYVDLCIKYYDIKLADFNFIGITGTDGKTTTASIVREIIDNCAYIGTNGLIMDDFSIETNNTTPCINEFYKYLRLIQDKGIKNVVMEVSSEALLHKRVNNIKFTIISFTNITGDHLNVHKTFDNYVKCKLKLLDLIERNGCVVVNGDDVNLRNLKCKNKYTFGYDSYNDYVIADDKISKKYVKISVNNKNNSWIISSPFKGKYNIYNVVDAFIIGLCFGVDQDLLVERIEKLKPIRGRGEVLDFGQKYTIVLDYAHTVNGVINILDAYKDYNKIITVTGCAGGREIDKRRKIGKVVMEKSSIAIFTMDDPRYENVDDIINQMVGDSKNYIRIVNREKAIHYALSIATEGSVVLILGKGRDSYMAIGGEKVRYNDYDVVYNYFL